MKRTVITKEMIDYIVKYFATTTTREIAICLGLHASTVHRLAHKLGLKKDQEIISTNRNKNIKKNRRIFETSRVVS